MLAEVLSNLFERDLNKLKAEIEQYSSDSDLWKISDGISNSAGNLCLHLTGNLKHFIGAVLGGSGYVRDRDAEFSSKNISKVDLLKDIESTAAVVNASLEKLTDDDFAKTYAIEVFGHPMKTGFFLAHLTTHLNYHLGQINYHRRLVANAKP